MCWPYVRLRVQSHRGLVASLSKNIKPKASCFVSLKSPANEDAIDAFVDRDDSSIQVLHLSLCRGRLGVEQTDGQDEQR